MPWEEEVVEDKNGESSSFCVLLDCLAEIHRAWGSDCPSPSSFLLEVPRAGVCARQTGMGWDGMEWFQRNWEDVAYLCVPPCSPSPFQFPLNVCWFHIRETARPVKPSCNGMCATEVRLFLVQKENSCHSKNCGGT